MKSANAGRFHRRGIEKAGIPVTFQRIIGRAPNSAVVSAEVTAVVRNYSPDTNQVARTGVVSTAHGAITQGDRQIIVMEADLAAKRYPLPVRKNDKIIAGGELLTVTVVDPFKRALAGAIELLAAGVA